MKKINLIIGIMLFSITSLIAQKTTQTQTIKVKGNCGMCERTIETAAKSVKGVKTADWDNEKNLLLVSFNPEKAEITDIHTAIAKAGYDTEKAKAEDKSYEALPGCCKYRK